MAGEHVWQGDVHAGQMAIEVGSAHPTGMHSCFKIILPLENKSKSNLSLSCL